MGALTRGAFAVAVLVAAGCATRPAADPFGATREGGDGGKMSVHFVRFEARCSSCTLNWVVRGQTGSDMDRGVFTHRVTLHLRPGETAHAQFTATPGGRGATVRYVRIFVDGELAGESVNEGTDQQQPVATVNGPLSATAVVSGSNDHGVGPTVRSGPDGGR